MDNTSIQIKRDTKKMLALLKIQLDFNSYDEVLKLIIKQYQNIKKV